MLMLVEVGGCGSGEWQKEDAEKKAEDETMTEQDRFISRVVLTMGRPGHCSEPHVDLSTARPGPRDGTVLEEARNDAAIPR